MEDERFEPRLGRMRSAGSRKGRKYLHSVLAAAARAGLSRGRSGRRFDGSRTGRGGVAARAIAGRDPYSGHRARRAVVKLRLVRLGGKALGAARAHLRYIERDGASPEGNEGRLYSADRDSVDGRAFLERCSGDRHQFRLILSAEDAGEYPDLRPLVRRFMARMEEDLGTGLEWVAADHADTLHPHSHVILRGRDERGSNLVIAPDYIRHGMRGRLSELVSLDLGPRTDLEIERRLRLDVASERLTPLDRKLFRAVDSSRIVSTEGLALFDQSLLSGRLRKLSALGLAEPLGGGRWTLADDLEERLRSLGERGDIIRTMQRALAAAGLERPAADQAVHLAPAVRPVTGRLVERGLADEQRDRHYLIVDGIDGRTHYIDIGEGRATEPLPEGAIVRVTSRAACARDIDRRIASIAAGNGGRYSVALHVAAGASAGFAEAHVRRLEAIRRRTGGIARADDGSWSIPTGFEALAARNEALEVAKRPVEVSLLSPLPLDELATHDGATWLDRELETPGDAVRDQGFGREVRLALSQRRAWLVEQGLAELEGKRLVPKPGFVTILERREIERAAAAIAAETGSGHAPIEPGVMLEGTLRRRLDLAAGRFALVDSGHQFWLVPWRPVLEQAVGREIAGRVAAGGAISWSFDRRSLGL
ncbi:MAG TPA: DUF3363 domain-containing protein [Sphingomicrobium sp.]